MSVSGSFCLVRDCVSGIWLMRDRERSPASRQRAEHCTIGSPKPSNSPTEWEEGGGGKGAKGKREKGSDQGGASYMKPLTTDLKKGERCTRTLELVKPSRTKNVSLGQLLSHKLQQTETHPLHSQRAKTQKLLAQPFMRALPSLENPHICHSWFMTPHSSKNATVFKCQTLKTKFLAYWPISSLQDGSCRPP